jgi:threonine dehydrogenase-like Zn-dependent dehydrogenase
MLAHTSQVHAVADDLDDTDAVMVEPLACAIHAALRARIEPDATVLVSGAGTMGLLTVAAVREVASGARIIAVAKHPRQRQEAEALGADVVCTPRDALRAVRLATRSMLHTPERGEPWLSSGVDVAFECVGAAAALDLCLRATRPRGRVVLVGLPGPSRIDLAPVWHRELEIAGAYTYGTEELNGGRVRTFDIAIEAARRLRIGRLVSATYPLSRHQEAIDHAMDAGRLDAIKVAFALGN